VLMVFPLGDVVDGSNWPQRLGGGEVFEGCS